MASSTKSDTIAANLGKLSIETSSSKQKPRAAKEKRGVVADSWEDEDVSSGSDDADDQDADSSREARDNRSGTSAPPPTPMTSTYNDAAMSNSQAIPEFLPSGAPAPRDVKRPEKTDAVARRMIASALGVKVPRMTEEQKKYDQAMKEKERRRRAEEKERQKREEEDALKAKQAVWEN